MPIAALSPSIIRVIFLIVLVVIVVNKFTDKQLLERAGAFYIAGNSTSLLLILISLAASAIGMPFDIENNTALTSLPIRLIFSAAGLAIGIIIYKSSRGVSVLSLILACIAAIISAINWILYPSFISELPLAFSLYATVAIIRQFRDKRSRSD